MLKAVYETRAKAIFIVNLMSLAEVPISDVKQKGDVCAFSVKGRYCKKAEDTLSKYGKEFRQVKDGTARGFVARNGARFGLYIGIAILALLAAVWSGLVTETRINGLDNVDESSVLNAVNEFSDFPTKKKNLDLDKLELLLMSLDGVSNVSLEIKGNVLFIDILEEVKPPNLIDFNDFSPIVSSYDAIITKVVTYSGTPLAEVGETVRKGDVLIAPYKIDAEGNRSEIKALGDIYGRTWITKEIVFTPTVIERKRTGRSKIFLVALGSRKRPEAPYELYDEEEGTVVCGALKLRKITFYEVEEIERNFDFEGEKDDIVKEKIAEIENGLPDGAEKVGGRYTEKTVDKNVVLVIYYEIIVKISAG